MRAPGTFVEAAKAAIQTGHEWRIRNQPQYLTREKLEAQGLPASKIQSYLDESSGWTGHDCHFQWTQNPTGNIDWCLYFVQALYVEVNWPLSTKVSDTPDGIYSLASATKFYDLASGPNCPSRWLFWEYADYNDPQAGDIILMKDHGCIVTGFDSGWPPLSSDDRPGRYLTLEGNRPDRFLGAPNINSIVTDYWSADNRSQQIKGFVRPIAAAT